ncbi:MAG: 2OG-Fe(II) oxygenase family protein [Gammaproteobacteria bacterium]|nr:2OG-Fe(II) oxygenase family protein [Gammaproteobacteria bacterium]
MDEGKRYSESIEQHFPITVMARQHHEVGVLNDKLFDWLEGEASAHANSGENAARNTSISTQGGYQTSTRTNIFQSNRPELRQLRDRHILPAAHHYLQSVFGGQARELDPNLIGWANLLAPGDWQSPHMHPSETNLASGVYYIRLPELNPPEGCIEFINPHTISVHHGFLTTRRIVPKEGLLLMFPPFYLHYVHPFRGESRRAIIAFDVLTRASGLKLRF